MTTQKTKLEIAVTSVAWTAVAVLTPIIFHFVAEWSVPDSNRHWYYALMGTMAGYMLTICAFIKVNMSEHSESIRDRHRDITRLIRERVGSYNHPVEFVEWLRQEYELPYSLIADETYSNPDSVYKSLEDLVTQGQVSSITAICGHKPWSFAKEYYEECAKNCSGTVQRLFIFNHGDELLEEDLEGLKKHIELRKDGADIEAKAYDASKRTVRSTWFNLLPPGFGFVIVERPERALTLSQRRKATAIVHWETDVKPGFSIDAGFKTSNPKIVEFLKKKMHGTLWKVSIPDKKFIQRKEKEPNRAAPTD